MPTVMVHSSGVRARVPVSDAHAIERSLQTAYARERIEDVVRGILEDALSPAPVDIRPWRDDPLFEAEFAIVVTDITDATTDLVAEQLSILLETVPPRLAGRLAAAPRFLDHT
jgi:hypothetical protein